MKVSFTLLDQGLGTPGLISHPHLACSLVFYRSQDLRRSVPVRVILYVWALSHKSVAVYKESLIAKIPSYFNSKLELHLQS